MVTGRQLWTTAALALIAFLVAQLLGSPPLDAHHALAWLMTAISIAYAVVLGYVAGSFRASLVLAPLFALLRLAYVVVWGSVLGGAPSRSILSAEIVGSLLLAVAFVLLFAQPGVALARWVASRRALAAQRS